MLVSVLALGILAVGCSKQQGFEGKADEAAAATVEDELGHQAYQSATRLVVPAVEGAPLDRLARVLAGLSEDGLGTSMFVYRRPGERGEVAWGDAAGEEPDGHQLAFVTEGLLALDGSGSGVGPEDFEMVAQTDSGCAVVVVRGDLEAESWQEYGLEDFKGFVTVAPAGTPPQVVDELSRAFEASSASRPFGKALVGTGREPAQRGPEGFAGFVEEQARRLSETGSKDP